LPKAKGFESAKKTGTKIFFNIPEPNKGIKGPENHSLDPYTIYGWLQKKKNGNSQKKFCQILLNFYSLKRLFRI
jgi:hypothetical protein